MKVLGTERPASTGEQSSASSPSHCSTEPPTGHCIAVPGGSRSNQWPHMGSEPDVWLDPGISSRILRHMTTQEAIAAGRASEALSGGLPLLPPFQQALATKVQRLWPDEVIEIIGEGNYLMQAPRLDGPQAGAEIAGLHRESFSQRVASIVGRDGEIHMLRGHGLGIDFGYRTAEQCLTGSWNEAIVWDVADGSVLTRWGDANPFDPNRALVAGCLNGATAILGAQDGKLTLWDIRTGSSRTLHEYTPDDQPTYLPQVRWIEHDRCSPCFAVALCDDVRLYDPRSGTAERIVRLSRLAATDSWIREDLAGGPHRFGPNVFGALHLSGTTLAFGDNRGIHMWDLRRDTSALLSPDDCPQLVGITGLDLDEDVLAVAAGNRLHLSSLRGQLYQTLETRDPWVTAVRLASRSVIAAGENFGQRFDLP